MEKGVIDFPNKENVGAWSLTNEDRIKTAAETLLLTDSIAKKIENARSIALRNDHNLQVYEQVNKLAQFSPKMLTGPKGLRHGRK